MLQSRTLADPHRHRWGFLAPSFGRRRCCPARCPLPLNCLRSAPRFFLFTPSTPSVLLPAIGTRDGWPPKADSAPAQAAQRPAGTFKAPGGWQRNEPLCQGQPGAAPGHQRQAAQAAGAGVRPRSAWTDRERRTEIFWTDRKILDGRNIFGQIGRKCVDRQNLFRLPNNFLRIRQKL